jgi:hypothetical protein
MSKESSFFADVVQQKISIRGQPAFAPLFFQEASLFAVVFFADLDAARAMVPTKRHHVLSPLPGKALVAFHCFNYVRSQIGSYAEVCVSLAVSIDAPVLGHSLALVQSILTETYHGHVLQLPVTSELALQGGIDYFNAPKTMARISYTAEEDSRYRRCQVCEPESGRLLFSLRVPALSGGRRLALPARATNHPRVMTLYTYPLIDQTITRAKAQINLRAAESRFFERRIALTLGDAPLMEPLHQLKLGRVAQFVDVPRCEMILYLPEPMP